MRAKEYLELHAGDIYHLELVKKMIHELYPLRFDRAKTEEYFNRYLFADARYRTGKNFNQREGEVERAIVVEVRNEIRHVIAGDESFVYAYNIIAEGRNIFCNYKTMKLCDLKEENINTVNEIKELYKNYKEDYPKTKLSDFLLESCNREFYDSHQPGLCKGKEWWIEAFNRAYELFDRARVQLDHPLETSKMITGLALEDADLKQVVVGIVCCLLEHYDFELTEVQKLKMDMLWRLVQDYYLNAGQFCNPGEEIEELKAAIARKDETINNLTNQLATLERETGKKGMTVGEIVLVFYYLFDKLGVNFSNSDKTQWARFIHTLSGKSLQNIRSSLYFNFDQKSTRKNLRNVANLFSELFPAIEQKILNDMKEA